MIGFPHLRFPPAPLLLRIFIRCIRFGDRHSEFVPPFDQFLVRKSNGTIPIGKVTVFQQLGDSQGGTIGYRVSLSDDDRYQMSNGKIDVQHFKQLVAVDDGMSEFFESVD